MQTLDKVVTIAVAQAGIGEGALRRPKCHRRARCSLVRVYRVKTARQEMIADMSVETPTRATN